MTAAAARAQEILKCDHIRFAIHPIDSYIALRDNFKELLESQPEVRVPHRPLLRRRPPGSSAPVRHRRIGARPPLTAARGRSRAPCS